MVPIEVEEQARKEGCSLETYFKRAMKWKHGQQHDTYLDVMKYQVHYIVADYVEAYTLHLQQAQKRRDEEIFDDLHLSEIQGRGD